MGAPIFTVDRRAVPYLRFVGMQVFDSDLHVKTKITRKLARVKGPEDTWTADVEINYGITTEVIREDVNHYNKKHVNPERKCAHTCPVFLSNHEHAHMGLCIGTLQKFLVIKIRF